MGKLKVYVCSLGIPTVDFVDKEGAMHACAQAQKTAFEGLTRISGILGNRYLSDEDRETLKNVEDFCNRNGLEFEVIDVGTINWVEKLQMKLRRIKTPAVSYEKKIFLGAPNDEDLKRTLGINK